MKILIVDDHAIVRTGLRRLLGMLPNIELEEAEDGRAALAMYRAALTCLATSMCASPS